MNRSRQLVAQRIVNHALAVDPATIGESSRHQFNPEMRLTLGPRTDMARMQMGFVDHLQGQRGERLGQFVFDILRNGHTGISSGTGR